MNVDCGSNNTPFKIIKNTLLLIYAMFMRKYEQGAK